MEKTYLYFAQAYVNYRHNLPLSYNRESMCHRVDHKEGDKTTGCLLVIYAKDHKSTVVVVVVR